MASRPTRKTEGRRARMMTRAAGARTVVVVVAIAEMHVDMDTGTELIYIERGREKAENKTIGTVATTRYRVSTVVGRNDDIHIDLKILLESFELGINYMYSFHKGHE